MKIKHFLFFLFVAIICVGLSACGGVEEDPETVRKDLAAMTDEQLIPTLLDNASKNLEPTVFSAEMSWVYRSGEAVIAEMSGTVRRNGTDRALTVTYTVEEESKTEEYVYRDGICYVNAGTKRKAAKSETEVLTYFKTLYPSFGNVADYNFTRKDLLRSDNGTYTLVLSAPANGIADSADILSPLTAVGNQTAPVTMSSFTDIYLTLFFSAEGSLMGQTLGFDCKMDADGVVTEGTALFRFAVTSISVAQLPISVPAESDSYTNTTDDVFAPSEDLPAADVTDDADGSNDTSSTDDE